MSTLTAVPVVTEVAHAVACEVRDGLTANPKTLSPWLFYDEAGSNLFEEITRLPEYYLTRTERQIFTDHADDIVEQARGGRCLAIVELGAGTATKTGILLRAALRGQSRAVYQPIDVSPSALEEAREALEASFPGLTVRPNVANYVTEPLLIDRPPSSRVLALYIGSSIGNFTPTEARGILQNLRGQLVPGDALLLGTDLAPGEHKDEAALLDAYDDAAGVTAAFNRNILTRINADLGADFDAESFCHRAVWNAEASRIEMHLESTTRQTVYVPANAACSAITLEFEEGETIHTENSYKFTEANIGELLGDCGFTPEKVFTDAKDLFAVTLARAI
ncbi:L-histidine N(alpha)-methyltransferase [Granulicella aggregans]|uniref:L-histidine N(alpha)-methyltransferase n=1 Tax=Granulicella aggregans TaxID=474949 RepID=UPI0021DF79F6|nr:L-histidine N(alpha)-methyltransferase [Granulicella aggregans]